MARSRSPYVRGASWSGFAAATATPTSDGQLRCKLLHEDPLSTGDPDTVSTGSNYISCSKPCSNDYKPFPRGCSRRCMFAGSLLKFSLRHEPGAVSCGLGLWAWD